MMSALEKAKALKEFRQLRAKFGVLVMSPLEKAKALKRFRELRGMLGGDQQNSGAANLIKRVSEAIETLVMIRIAERDDGAEMHDTKYINKINEVISFLKKSGDDAAISQITDMIAVAEKENGVSLLGGDGGAAQNEEPTAFTQAGAAPQANVASVTASSLNADEMFDPAELENMRVPKLKSREKLISMKITDFLKMAAEGRDPEKESGINELVSSGQKFSDLPFLRCDNDGDVVKITGHEGRHRARKLLEMGYKYMPVVLKINPGKAASIRWDQQADPNRFDYVKQWPTTLEGEHGDTMPFPVTREQAGENYRPAQGDAAAAAQAVPQDQPQADAIDTSLLTAIISGQIDTFKDRAKLQELSDALAKAGGDDMPSGEVRDLFENAIRAAGKQVLTGFGYLAA